MKEESSLCQALKPKFENLGETHSHFNLTAIHMDPLHFI